MAILEVFNFDNAYQVTFNNVYIEVAGTFVELPKGGHTTFTNTQINTAYLHNLLTINTDCS